MSRRWMVFLFGLLLLTPGCIGNEEESETIETYDEDQPPITLDVWYSFTTDSKEEDTFLDAIESFETLKK